MTFKTQADAPAGQTGRNIPEHAKHKPYSAGDIALHAAIALGLFAALLLFYGSYYSVHNDLAGIILSSHLAETLGPSFESYSLYFPPAERAWYTLAVWLSEWTGIRLDLSAIVISGAAGLFSVSLAYHIRRMTVGASPSFLILSLILLMILPILYKNVFGLRAHMVVLGLWPYIILRLSDPTDNIIGRKTRIIVGLWLGATLLLKYLYSLVVFLIELADAIVQRSPRSLFRIENLISGAIVALYMFFWLIIDPSQQEAIATVVSAIDANLVSQQENWLNVAIYFALSLLFILLALAYKLPVRETLIGLAMVVGAIIAALIQSRWYSHHTFPIIIAYICWLWMIHRNLKLLWIVAIAMLFIKPITGEFRSTASYQLSVGEVEAAIEASGQSVEGKRVGLLAMHPSPFNQYLAANGGMRWITSANNAYVAAELKAFDRPENAGITPSPVTLDEPGRQLLHDDMLRLWEDMPPDILILDQSTSWPLQYIGVQWEQTFAQDDRFQTILSQYRPVFKHQGEWVEFQYFVRIDSEE